MAIRAIAFVLLFVLSGNGALTGQAPMTPRMFHDLFQLCSIAELSSEVVFPLFLCSSLVLYLGSLIEGFHFCGPQPPLGGGYFQAVSRL